MTAPATTFEGPIATLREREIELLNDIATELTDFGDETAGDRQRLRDVAQDLRDMFFMVAVIGEFNAGKSSFVNSLIGEKLLPMGITPTTEYIELIRYNVEPQLVPVVREDGLREWAHPNTGAPGVAIVDTPGTGSVFEAHENTAHGFLHRSDLVIFLISAKHAFAETERMYLELAKSYGKKIILVVNQVDLLNASEQQEVRRFIESQIKEKLNLDPLIFMVSAKQALEAAGMTNTPAISESNGTDSSETVPALNPVGDAGGIETVKAHLRGVYSEAPPAKQKLLAQLDTAGRIVQNYLDNMKAKSDTVSGDLTRVT
ncbi:MAG: dynamin family protein, partial [Aggregatilineales bacterium]